MGKAVWRRVLADLGDGWELDARELLILESACRQADGNAQLEAAIDADGVTVRGSMGQPRLNAMVTELRQGRLALERLLASLALPGDEGAGAQTAAQKRASAAASSRWIRSGRRGGRRGAA